MARKWIGFVASVADQATAESEIAAAIGYAVTLNIPLADTVDGVVTTHYCTYLSDEPDFLRLLFDSTTVEYFATVDRHGNAWHFEAMLQYLEYWALDDTAPNAGLGAGQKFVLIEGVKELETTLAMGPTDGFATLAPLAGYGPKRRLEGQNFGSGLEALFSDKPMVNVSGARVAPIQDLWFRGARVFDDITYTMNEEAYWGNQDDDTPHAAITIDNEDDGSPLNPSSGVRIARVGGDYLEAFIVAQPVPADSPDHPGGLDANADFTIIEKAELSFMKFCFVFPNSQSRNVALRDVNAARVWCVVTDQGYGLSRGTLGGPIDNLSVGGFVKYLFIFRGTAAIGPLLWTCTYGENMQHIGKFTGNTSAEGAMLFLSSNFKFDHIDPGGFGVPANLIEGSNTGAQIYRNLRTSGTNVFTADALMTDVRLLDGSRVLSRIEPASPVEARIASSSCFIALGKPHNHDLKVTLYDDALAETVNVPTKDFDRSDLVIPDFLNRARYAEGPGEFSMRRRALSRPIGNFTIDSIVGRVHTLTMTPGIITSDREAWQVGFCAGGWIRDRDTGTVLWIYSRTGNTIVAKAINNYNQDDSMKTALAGNLEFTASSHFAPKRAVYGTLVRGSATVQIVGDPDGLSVGDQLATHQLPMYSPQTPVFGNLANDDALADTATRAAYPAILSEVNRRSLVFTGCVSLIDHPMLELPVWVRPPPANEVP